MMKHDNIMTTATGGYFNFTNPLKSKINVLDIAHSLSNICRFSGHTKEFYSIAEHSVMVYKYCVRYGVENDISVTPRTLMYAIMHDAGESFTSDIPKPFKKLFPEVELKEKEILHAIFYLLELDISATDFELVRRADKFILFKEAKDLLTPSSSFRYVWGPGIRAENEILLEMMEDTDEDMIIQRMNPGDAQETFLEVFNELRWKRS